MKLILISVAMAICLNFIIDFAWSRTAVARDGDCTATGTTCPTTDCCGTATPVSGSTTKKICNQANLTTWIDTAAANAPYYFACDASDGAVYLTAGAAVVAANIAMMS